MSVPHTDLNRARLPIPPRPHIHFMFSTEQNKYTIAANKKQALFLFFSNFFVIKTRPLPEAGKTAYMRSFFFASLVSVSRRRSA